MRSLAVKLGLAFLVVSVTGVIVAAIFAQIFTRQAFNQVALNSARSNFIQRAADYYQAHGSWIGIADFFYQPGFYGASQFPPNNPPGQPMGFMLTDTNNTVFIPGRTTTIGESLPADKRTDGTPVTVGGKTVGIVYPDGQQGLSKLDQDTLARTNAALLYGSLAAIVIALGLGIILARSLTRPARELTSAIHAIGDGDIHPQVPVRSRDELGELTRAFNQMSADLDRANRQRRQMTADIAHDLRTPLTVIEGYLEAMRDGTLAPTPARFGMLYDEARHLHRLIDDLRLLSLADAGELSLHCESVDVGALLRQVAAAYELQAKHQHITLDVHVEPQLPPAALDYERMTQMLGNLVSNALRYTPPDGTITLTANHHHQDLVLLVRDTGTGIDPAALPHIFDRFYRADVARAQTQGESGLGLAITKAIVEAHRGSIAITSELGRGTTFTITLPASKPS